MMNIKTSSILFAMLILCFGIYQILADHKIDGSFLPSRISSMNDDLIIISRVGMPIIGSTSNSSIIMNAGSGNLERGGNLPNNTGNLLPSEILTSKNRRILNTPTEFKLFGNYPNPFNPSTTIRFDIPVATTVTIKVYDIRGQEVATLLNGQYSEPGSYEMNFDASQFCSGIYLYRMMAGNFTSARKMMLMK